MTDKAQIIAHLNTIAQLKIIAGANQFSVAAYQNACKKLEVLPAIDSATLANTPGIGDKIVKAVEQFVKTGTSDAYKELAKGTPVECLTMTAVQGIGPKTALKLHQSGIKNFDELVAAAEKNELKKKGVIDFKLIKAVLFARDTKAGRLPYNTAKAIGDDIIKIVKATTGIKNAELCGSLRRKRSTIKDLDILACAEDKTKYTQLFKQIINNLGTVLVDVVNQGDVKCALRVSLYSVKIAADIWLVEPGYWGSALNYATGSKIHNAKLRGMAAAKGLLVNEYGIFENRGSGKRIGGADEHDLYRILEVPYVEPEDREN
jgi:DNA polymerase (family X)